MAVPNPSKLRTCGPQCEFWHLRVREAGDKTRRHLCTNRLASSLRYSSSLDHPEGSNCYYNLSIQDSQKP